MSMNTAIVAANTSNTALDALRAFEDADILVGNHFDSRQSAGHSVSAWTEGADYALTLADGRQYAYRTRRFTAADGMRVTRIDPSATLAGTRPITWAKVPSPIKEELFTEIFPDGCEADRNLFILGLAEGTRVNNENKWADAHLIENRRFTLQLRKEIGEFKQVSPLGFRMVTDYWAKYRAQYIIDGVYRITVDTNSDHKVVGHKVERELDVVAGQKAWGQRVASLANKAGVPWQIASLAGDISDDGDAIKALTAVRTARDAGVSVYQSRELACGLARRMAVLKAVIGEDILAALNVKGQGRSSRLASYLLGKEEN